MAVADNARLAIFLAWGQECAWCHRPLTFREMEIDHLIPESLDDEELAAVIAMHSLPADYGLQEWRNLIPACHVCNQDKSRRIAPQTPRMGLLLEDAEKRAPEIEKHAAAFTKKKGFDKALGVVLATAAAGALDADAAQQLRAALEVIEPTLIEAGAVAPNAEVALHPAMQKIWGDWQLLSALSEEVAFVTDGERAGYIGTDISFMCSQCGSYGPWNGIICLVCGNREAPDY